MSKHDTSHTSEPARRADAPAQPDWSRRSAQLLAGVAVIVLVVMGINLGSTNTIAPSPAPDVQTTGLPEGETPEPYYYDEANDRHWHEVPGRPGHWDPGPPPETQRTSD
ncbi:MAG: hypothetical protein WDZ31_03285 [Phycisphaeraceae bacterium]